MSNAAAIASLAQFSASLRKLPTSLGIKVAEAAAPELTSLAQATFAASQDAFGDAWDAGSEGQTVKLRRSGALASKIRYVAIGTKLRIVLGVDYAKYQVGRRPVTPRQGEPLPVAYAQVLTTVAATVIRAELGR